MLKHGLSIAWTIMKAVATLLIPVYVFQIVFALYVRQESAPGRYA